MQQAGSAETPRRLADFLRERHGEIMARWEAEVRRMRPARFLSRPVLIDHVPDFLRQLAEFVGEARENDRATPPDEFPVVHALERLDLGYDLAEVVEEYGILRQCILTLAHVEESPSRLSAELPRLHQAIDLAIGASVARYAHARERTLKALDRISTAALAERDLDSFLGKTLSALLETTAAIDSASILLIEGDRLRVRAAAGLAIDPSDAQEMTRGQCIAGTVWKTGEPMLVRDAESDPRVSTNTIRRRGTHALYAVPLMLGTDVIGVAMMGSASTYEFSHEDLLLFRTAASRAAALVAQARLDEAVRRQTALYESIVSALGDMGEGFAILESERITFVNDALCRIIGRNPEQVYALSTILELLPPERRTEGIRARLRGAGDSANVIETAFERADGKLVMVELGLKRKPNGRVIAIVRDVTPRLALERQRADEHAQLEAVVEVLPVGLVMAEAPGGKLILYNREAQRILGRPAHADSIEGYADYHGLHPDGTPLAPDEWPLARAILSGKLTESEEIQVIAADGVRRITEQRAAAVRDVSGEVIAGVVTLVDITERKHTEEELRRALAFRDQILNVLAHDLRQPLSVVGSSASILLRKEGMEPHAGSILRIVRNVERMDRMIRDLLDYARAKRGAGIPVHRRRVDLADVAKQAIESIQTVHPERPVRLEVSGDCHGQFDADRMLQVFGNLLGNAAHYSPPKSPIDVVMRCDKDGVVCRVHNLGTPIAKAQLATIFEPFRRGTSSANPQGVGLGLFIVEQIVQAHGGVVEVSSTPEEGTTFTLRLPLQG